MGRLRGNNFEVYNCYYYLVLRQYFCGCRRTLPDHFLCADEGWVNFTQCMDLHHSGMPI
jgi:hypothetical protein